MKISSIPQNQPSKSSWTDVLIMADPDLECPEHDKMSIALADPEFTLELLRAVSENAGGKKTIVSTAVQLEYPVTQGIGKWKKIIGFLDALCTSCVEFDGEEEVPHRFRAEKFLTAIEAKPVVTNPTQVLRQLRTYREFLPPSINFVLWCPTLSPSVNHVFTTQQVYVCNLPILQIQSRIKTQ